jgi:hypothetical protein
MKIRLSKISGILGFGDTFSINLKSNNIETTIDLKRTEALRLKKLLEIELEE